MQNDLRIKLIRELRLERAGSSAVEEGVTGSAELLPFKFAYAQFSQVQGG